MKVRTYLLLIQDSKSVSSLPFFLESGKACVHGSSHFIIYVTDPDDPHTMSMSARVRKAGGLDRTANHVSLSQRNESLRHLPRSVKEGPAINRSTHTLQLPNS